MIDSAPAEFPSFAPNGSAAVRPPAHPRRWSLRPWLKAAPSCVAGAVLCLSLGVAQAQGTLRVAMTASDIPLPNGQTDQGAEGMRFMGYTVFEALVAYDLSSADKPTSLIPGLATEWKVEADKLRWTFKLRPGVKFHDGSPFTADDAVFSLERAMAKTSNFTVYTQGITKVVKVNNNTIDIITIRDSPSNKLLYRIKRSYVDI